MSTAKTRERQQAPARELDCMKAAVIVKEGMAEARHFPLPEPEEGQVRVRMLGCGLCASNIPLWEGRPWFQYPTEPGVPGHEGWGIIEAVGPGVHELQPGQRVCFLSDKAYATHDLAWASQVVEIPGHFHDLPFPGEPLGCAMNIFDRSDILPGQWVGIVGAGFLGLLLIQLCKAAGARVIAISKRQFSLQAAHQAGADHIIPLDDHWKIIERVKQLTGEQLCQRVIEATGKEWPLNLSIEVTGVRGRLMVAGFHQDGMRQVNMQMLNWRGIDLISTHEREPTEYIRGMKKAIAAIEQKRMNPRPWFTHQFALEDIATAFNHLVQRPEGFIKGLIIF